MRSEEEIRRELNFMNDELIKEKPLFSKKSLISKKLVLEWVLNEKGVEDDNS